MKYEYNKKDSSRLRSVWLGLIGCAVPIVAGGLLFGWEPVDDAYISFRYALNFSAGHGFVFNPGQPVEGYTNFLWTAILGVGGRLGFAIPRLAMWLGVGFAVLAIYLTWRLGRRIAEERGWPIWFAFVPAAILAFYPGWSYWALSGMEGPMLSCLLLGFLLVGCDRGGGPGKLTLAGIFGVLLAMTRWEAVLLWPVVILAQFFDGARSSKQRIGRACLFSGLLLIGFGIYFAWRFAYYGQLLPNTYYAKIGGSLIPRILGGLIYTGEFAIGWMLPITLIIWLLKYPGYWATVILATLMIYLGYVTWTGGDHFPWLRFYLPVLPLAAIITAELIHMAASLVKQASRASLVRLVLTVAVIITMAGTALRIDYRSAKAQQRWVTGWKQIGNWAEKAFPKNYRIALAPVGAAAYYSRHAVIDMLGLTDYQTAHWGQTDTSEAPGHQRSNIESVLKRKPEVILGQALMTKSVPTEQEAMNQSIRKALKKMYKLTEFRRLYKFQVARIGEQYVPYWILNECTE